jgi:hypothetical protein
VRRAAVLPIALLAGGCSSALTSSHLEPSFAEAFGGLYAVQQAQDGRAGLTRDALGPKAACRRTGPDAQGPGEDWVCAVRFRDLDTVLTQVFQVQLKPDGCWKAEGSPVQQPAVRVDALTGKGRPNPLAEFDGCLDTSWG